MTDASQLDGPELWLAVAKVMGIEISTNGAGLDPYPIRIHKDVRTGEDVRIIFNPKANPTDAWAMHQYVRGRGYDVHYWTRLTSDGGGIVCSLITEDDEIEGEGPDDETALGRAIVEMGQ